MVISITEHPSSSSDDFRLFTVDLHGEIITVTVTSTTSVVRRWISAVNYFYRDFLDHLVVGLGVQWTPGYKDDPADTLQLCVGHRCLIYQLTHTDYVPKILRRFLLNPNNTFVGFWNHSDREKLEKTKHRLQMYRDPEDLRYVETNDGESLVRAPMEEIVEEWLGYTDVRLDREISMSDWDDEFLSHGQVLQASLDAFCAFEIGKNIGAWRLTRSKSYFNPSGLLKRKEEVYFEEKEIYDDEEEEVYFEEVDEEVDDEEEEEKEEVYDEEVYFEEVDDDEEEVYDEDVYFEEVYDEDVYFKEDEDEEEVYF